MNAEAGHVWSMEHDAENTQDLDGRLHLLINQGTYLAGEFRGTAYRPIQTYKDPSDNSKIVLSIVKIGPLTGVRTTRGPMNCCPSQPALGPPPTSTVVFRVDCLSSMFTLRFRLVL